MENQEIFLGIIVLVYIVLLFFIVTILYFGYNMNKNIDDVEEDNEKLKQKTVNMTATKCVTNFEGTINVSGIDVKSSILNLQSENLSQQQQINSINQELQIIEEELLKISNKTKTLYEDVEGALFSENLKISKNLYVYEKANFKDVNTDNLSCKSFQVDTLNSVQLNSDEINSVLTNTDFLSSNNGASIFMCPAGYIITDLLVYYPLISTMPKFLPANISKCTIVLNCGFKIKIYFSENYGLDFITYDNTEGITPKSFVMNGSNSLKSFKIYFKNKLINFFT